ncbi:helix-turn-helix domain-containing protein [Alteribacter populi]|uniref:helix-turn-helix domain-containing protein n=1 Tax=Alteribacter populi TaxID=2011011 RepID=UPI0018E1DF92|nr:helix-turn-helix domain-containing protein [Alteribacter populi]
MSELGIRLKAAREELGLSLDEMQTRTKIQKRYLIAIEEGAFERLPGEFYARAFVKNYAEAVGMDAEMLFDEHYDELPQPKREPSTLPPRVSRTNAKVEKTKVTKKKSKFSSFLPTLIIALFLAAVVAGIWIMNLNGENGDDGAVPRESTNPGGDFDDSNVINDDDEVDNEEDENGEEEANTGEDEVEEEAPEEEETGNQELTLEGTEGYNSTMTLSNTDEFNVRVEFTDGSWTEVKDGEGTVLDVSTYSEGDELTYDMTDEEAIEINIGFVPSVDIYINDELLDYPLDPSDQDRQRIIIQFSLDAEQ